MVRFPRKPPDFRTLLNNHLKGDRLQKMLSAAIPAAPQNRYLHWDDLRFRRAPEDLSKEEWWFCMRTARTPLFKEIPLQSTDGSPFRYCLTDRAHELLTGIDQQGTGRHVVREEVARTGTRDRYLFNSLSEEAIASSLLEGAATTRMVAKEMLRTGRKPRTTGERMIMNNYNAIRTILDRKGDPMTPELVLELQEVLTHDTDVPIEAVGRLRRANEPVRVYDEARGEILHTPPSADQLPKRLEALCAFANSADSAAWHHPVVRAIMLHLWLAYDHPFVDGNGRTARALFYWSMLAQGYWLFEFISISRLLYKASAAYTRSFLLVETDEYDSTYFLLAQLEIIQRAIEDLWRYVERKEAELRDKELRLRAVGHLNYRQLTVVSHALRHPEAVYSIHSHRRSHNVAYATARADLLDLVDRGLLRQWKRGKAYAFGPVEDLLSRVTA